MVICDMGYSLIVVLYAFQDRTWKIADFGLTVQGSSSVAQTTECRRGTSGYRAPELINENTNKFTNKVDIFAVGCIFFELVFRQKAFRDDFHVLRYALDRGEGFAIPETSDVFPDERRREFISQTIQQMIQLNYPKRPKAKELHRLFEIGTTNPLNQLTSTSQPEVRPTQTDDIIVGRDGKP